MGGTPSLAEGYSIPAQVGTLSLPGGTPSLAGVPPHPNLARVLGPVIEVPPGRDLGPVTGLPPWEGTWDQSLGYPHGKDIGPVEVLLNGDGVPPPPPRVVDKVKI